MKVLEAKLHVNDIDLLIIAQRISARLDLFSQSTYVRTCVRRYVVGHAQECHAECRYIP